MADVFSLICHGSTNIHHDVLTRKYVGNASHSGDTSCLTCGCWTING